MGFKKILEKFKEKIEVIEFNSKIHTICPECDGTRVDYPGHCTECKGKGYVDKNRQDLWREKFEN